MVSALSNFTLDKYLLLSFQMHRLRQYQDQEQLTILSL
jgi:hypothetical protein